MEDDVQVMRDPCIISDLIDDLDKLVGKENWDVLYTYRGQGGPSGLHLPADWKPSRPDFHCQNLLNLHQPVSEKFIRTGSRWGTHSMIIRHSGMVKILEFLKTHKLFYPYDVEIWLPPGIQLFAVIDDVVSTIAGAISDTGVEIRNTVRARTAAKVGTSRTTLTPVENDLFLLTARTELSQIEKQRLAQLLEKQPLHWGYLIQLAQVNGTYPLLHRHLCDAKNLDPPHALSELKQTVRTTAQENSVGFSVHGVYLLQRPGSGHAGVW
jgi:hypothetical protein